MPRKPPPALQDATPANATDTANPLPALAIQHAQVADVLGYEAQYDTERVVQETQFFLDRSAESLLEAGKRLILLKEHCPHGEFTELCQQRLSLSPRTAQKMMQAAIKYLSPALAQARPTLVALGRPKLMELLVEDDTDLAELTAGGTVAGLTLDDIERFSPSELRRHLREAREEAAAQASLLTAKNAKIDALEAKARRVKSVPPDEVFAQLVAEVSARTVAIDAQLRGHLRAAFEALDAHCANAPAGGASSPGAGAVVLAGQLHQINSAVAALASEFGLMLDPAGAPNAALHGWAIDLGKPGADRTVEHTVTAAN
jgi:hypothetical protein